MHCIPTPPPPGQVFPLLPSCNSCFLASVFVQSATLTQDGEEPDDKVDGSDDEPKEDASDGSGGQGKEQNNRDEEFFRACAGRTAHK